MPFNSKKQYDFFNGTVRTLIAYTEVLSGDQFFARVRALHDQGIQIEWCEHVDKAFWRIKYFRYPIFVNQPEEIKSKPQGL